MRTGSWRLARFGGISCRRRGSQTSESLFFITVALQGQARLNLILLSEARIESAASTQYRHTVCVVYIIIELMCSWLQGACIAQRKLVFNILSDLHTSATRLLVSLLCMPARHCIYIPCEYVLYLRACAHIHFSLQEGPSLDVLNAGSTDADADAHFTGE